MHAYIHPSIHADIHTHMWVLQNAALTEEMNACKQAVAVAESENDELTQALTTLKVRVNQLTKQLSS